MTESRQFGSAQMLPELLHSREPILGTPAVSGTIADEFPAALQVKQIEEQISALAQLADLRFQSVPRFERLEHGRPQHASGGMGPARRRRTWPGENSLGDIEVAALLHDIGKIGIADAILNKPAKLDR